MSSPQRVALLACLVLTGCRSDLIEPVLDGGNGTAATDLADAGGSLGWGDDLMLTVVGLAKDQGLTAWLRINNTARNDKTPWRPVRVEGGRVQITWPGGFDRNTYGLFVELFIDRDGDGACSLKRDPAWSIFLSNDVTPGVYAATVDVGSSGVPGQIASPVDCDSFQ